MLSLGGGSRAGEALAGWSTAGSFGATDRAQSVPGARYYLKSFK